MSTAGKFTKCKPLHQRQHVPVIPPQNVASSSSASTGTWTCSSRTHSLKSRRKHNASRAHDELSDDVDVSYYDWQTDSASNSSTTLSSRSLSPSFVYQPGDNMNDTFDAFRPVQQNRTKHSFVFPLHEPGERTMARTLRLRARTADVIGSLPATVERADVADHDSLPRAASSPVCRQNASSLTLASSKLRRIPGRANLRDSFCSNGRSQTPPSEDSESERSEPLSEHDIVPPARSLSPMTVYSSADTLVDFGSRVYPSTNDGDVLQKYITSKAYSASLPISSSHVLCPSNNRKSAASPPSLRRRSSSLAYAFHHENDDRPYAGEHPVWSCAKIAQSALKRTARRRHALRRAVS